MAVEAVSRAAARAFANIRAKGVPCFALRAESPCSPKLLVQRLAAVLCNQCKSAAQPDPCAALRSPAFRTDFGDSKKIHIFNLLNPY